MPFAPLQMRTCCQNTTINSTISLADYNVYSNQCKYLFAEKSRKRTIDLKLNTVCTQSTNLCHKTIAIIVQYKNSFDNIH